MKAHLQVSHSGGGIDDLEGVTTGVGRENP